MTKEKWMEFCKAVTPHMDAICAAMEEAGIGEETCAGIAVYADGYASMYASFDGTFYNCLATEKENAYSVSKEVDPIEGGQDFIGTLPRSWKGGGAHDGTGNFTGGTAEDL